MIVVNELTLSVEKTTKINVSLKSPPCIDPMITPFISPQQTFQLQSRPPLALMSQSMAKEPAQDTKLPQILLGALFVKLLSDWKHCEDQQIGALTLETIST